MSKKIMLTGCNGQLGKALTKAYSKDGGVELILTGSSELDISDNEKVLKCVRDIKPDTIINCAAFTAVDACETEFDKAFKEALKAKGPVLIDCIIDKDEKVFPMVPGGAPISEAFDADDLKKKEK